GSPPKLTVLKFMFERCLTLCLFVTEPRYVTDYVCAHRQVFGEMIYVPLNLGRLLRNREDHPRPGASNRVSVDVCQLYSCHFRPPVFGSNAKNSLHTSQWSRSTVSRNRTGFPVFHAYWISDCVDSPI